MGVVMNMRVTGARPNVSFGDETPGSVDKDPIFINLEDQVWESLWEWRNNPSDLTAEVLFTSVNKMNAYLSSLTISQDNNPQAFKIQGELNAGGRGSLVSYAKDFSASNISDFIALRNKYDTLYNDINITTPSSAYADKGKADVQNLIEYLKADIHGYYNDLKENPPDPERLNDDLCQIAVRIHQLASAGANLTDGFLQPLMLMLGLPINSKIPEVTFLSLSDKIYNALASKPPTIPAQADLDALKNALLMKGDDLKNMVEIAEKEEYH
jgi:hypothetical protein